jgi:hypothetical protein
MTASGSLPLNAVYFVGAAGAAGAAAGACGVICPGIAGRAVVSVTAARTPCDLNCRVNENSPRLCPTIVSVVYTGLNFCPLGTPTVGRTICGGMGERRVPGRGAFG